MSRLLKNILISLVIGSIIGAYLMYLLMPKPISEDRMKEIVSGVAIENKVEVKSMDLSEVSKMKNVEIHFYQCGDNQVETTRYNTRSIDPDTTIYLLNQPD